MRSDDEALDLLERSASHPRTGFSERSPNSSTLAAPLPPRIPLAWREGLSFIRDRKLGKSAGFPCTPAEPSATPFPPRGRAACDAEAGPRLRYGIVIRPTLARSAITTSPTSMLQSELAR